jgi:DNA-binding NarL/FixJ family response regulator
MESTMHDAGPCSECETPVTKIRLAIADDHPIVLDGLAQLFSSEPGFDIVGRAEDGEKALRAVRQLQPDVLVLDLRMPGKDGLAVLRAIRDEKLPTNVAVLTALDDEPVFEAIRLGARGVVLKDMASRFLLRCVRQVHAGGKWIERGVAERAFDKLMKHEEEGRAIEQVLTPRERDVARLIADGLSNKAVARTLRISEGTTKLHLHHVYEKLQLDGRVNLLRYMYRLS